MNLPSPIAKLRFKINVGQEEKHELKPRISAMCKISFELFAKSPSRKRTHELSVNKGFFFFFFKSMENVRFYICNFLSSAFLLTTCIQNCFSL